MARPLTTTLVNGASHSSTQSKSGGYSVRLDGDNDHLNTEQPNFEIYSTGDWTLEAWVRFDSPPVGLADGPNYYLFKGEATGYTGSYKSVDVRIGLNPNNINDNFIAVDHRNGSSNGIAAWNGHSIDESWIVDQQWHHIAVTRTSGTIKIWFDGVGRTTTQPPGGTNTDLIYRDSSGNAIDVLSGGIDSPGDPTPLSIDGYIDEIRISNVAQYSTNFTPASSLDFSGSLLMLHLNNDTVDGPIVTGSAKINIAQTNLTSDSTYAPIVEPDGVTWDEIDTWDTWYVNDNWTAAQKFESSITLSATGAKLQLGSAELNLGAIGIATAENFAFAESQLDLTFDTNVRGGRILDGGSLFIDTGTWDETDTWDTFDPDQWEIPYGLAEMDVIASGGYLVGGEAELNLATVNATAGERIVGGSAELNLATVQIVAGESIPPTQGEAQLDISVSLEATAEEFDRASAELNIVLASTVDANYAHFGSAQLPIDINLEADAQDFDRATAQIDMSMSITATPTRILSTAQAELPITLTQEVDVLNVKGGAANLDITLSAEQQSRLFVGGTNTSNIELGVEAEADDFDNAASLLLTNMDLTASPGIILESAEANLNLATIKISEAERIVGSSTELPIQLDLQIAPTIIPDIKQFTLPIEMATEVDGDITLDGRATLNLASVKLTDANMFRGVSARLDINLQTTADSGVNFVGSANLPLANILLSDAESRGPVLGSAILPLATIQLVDGELRLLDSDFTFRIYAETRLLTPKSETRIYKPYSETRVIEVDS
jgi:hypothetical protein